MEAKQIMLASPNSVKAVTYVNYNVTDDLIGGAIREAQEIHLQSIIGTALLRRLQDLVKNKIENEDDNIDSEANAAYKHLLDEYVEPYLISTAQFLLCTPLTFKVRNMGVVQSSDTNVDRVLAGDLNKVEARFKNESLQRATKLSKYLCKYKSTYPELESTCDCNETKPMIGRKFVNVPLNLGQHRGDCCCD